MNAKDLAQTIDLTKPLDAKFLNAMSLDEFFQRQARGRMFRITVTDDDGRKVFVYECEPRFAQDNLFVPGAWFADHLDALDELRRRRDENSIAFPGREKDRLIEKMIGREKTAEAAA
jgi:hypothetical protein